jgi:hypothetical protein
VSLDGDCAVDGGARKREERLWGRLLFKDSLQVRARLEYSLSERYVVLSCPVSTRHLAPCGVR